jgi:hypothetical protein
LSGSRQPSISRHAIPTLALASAHSVRSLISARRARTLTISSAIRERGHILNWGHHMANAPAPTPRPVATRAPATPVKSRLEHATRGLLKESKRFFFYGPEGVGKSSLAADAPAPIFFDTDRGSGAIDVRRYRFRDTDDGHFAESFDEIIAAVDDLLVSPHSYQTLVIDTTDSLEALIWKHVCDKAGVTKSGDRIDTIEDFGYGKGFAVAADEWRKLLHRLDTLRLRRAMHIVFVGHALVKTFKNPTGEDYDRFRPKLDDRALGLLKEWCEVVGFVTFDDLASRTKGSTRARGVSTGTRIIHLEHNAAWDAKSRLPLAAQIDLDLERPWSPFANALDVMVGVSGQIKLQIEAELTRLGDDFVRSNGDAGTATGVRAAIVAAGDDSSTLTRYLTALKQSTPAAQRGPAT